MGSWWAPRSSTPVRPSTSVWRVRFPSASATPKEVPVTEPVDRDGPNSAGLPVPPDVPGADATTDPRRRIPRTDHRLALPEPTAAAGRRGTTTGRDLARTTQDRARRGEIPPEEVPAALREALVHRRATSLTPVLNATGVVVHTNLGRAPLSAAAVEALVAAAGDRKSTRLNSSHVAISYADF